MFIVLHKNVPNSVESSTRRWKWPLKAENDGSQCLEQAQVRQFLCRASDSSIAENNVDVFLVVLRNDHERGVCLFVDVPNQWNIMYSLTNRRQ